MSPRTTDHAIVVNREPKPRDAMQAELVSLRLEAARLRRELSDERARLRRELCAERKAHQASRERVMLLERKYWELMMRRLRPKG
jgi:hypothetical protein